MKEICFDDQTTLRAALQEGKIMSKIYHKHICRYFDTLVQNKKLYTVMEYCDKGDLSAFLLRMQIDVVSESRIY